LRAPHEDFHAPDGIRQMGVDARTVRQGAILATLKRIGYVSKMTGHGLRSLAMESIQ